MTDSKETFNWQRVMLVLRHGLKSVIILKVLLRKLVNHLMKIETNNTILDNKSDLDYYIKKYFNN